MPQKNWGIGFEEPSPYGELYDAALTIAEMARRKKPGEERTAWSYKPLCVDRGESESIENAIARTLSAGLCADIQLKEIDNDARQALNDDGNAIVIFRNNPTLTNLNIDLIKTPMTLKLAMTLDN